MNQLNLDDEREFLITALLDIQVQESEKTAYVRCRGCGELSSYTFETNESLERGTNRISDHLRYIHRIFPTDAKVMKGQG